jgi:MFS family permease
MLFGHLGSSLFHPTGANVSSSLGLTKQEKSFAIFATIGTLGYAFSQPLFSAFTNRFGVSKSILMAIPTVILAIYYIIFSKIKIQSQSDSLHIKEFVQLLVSRFVPILLLFLIMVFRTAFVYSMNSFLAKTFEEWGFSRHVYNSANTVFMLAGGGGILAAGFLTTLIKPRKLLFFTLVGFFPFFLLFIYYGKHDNFLLSFVFLALSGFVLHGGYGTNIIMGHRIAPKMMSTISGILMGFAWATSSFGPTLCAFSTGFFPWVGGFGSGLLTVSVFPLIAAFLTLYLSKEVEE